VLCREIQARKLARPDDQKRLVPTLHLDRSRTAMTLT
jgi:hypothetical protein